MPEWYADESFWRDLYPFMFTEERFEQAKIEADKIVHLTPVIGKSILDLGCGPGRFSIPLANRGYMVTGVDKSPYLLEKARLGGQSAGLDIEWIEDDMREFLRPGAFDLTISMFSSFGYFNRKEEDMLVLRNIHANLKSGGVCLMDLAGKEMMARFYQPTISEKINDGSILIHRHEIVDDWTRIKNEWILVRGETAKRFYPILTLYSAQEMKDRLSQVGFIDVKVYGDLDGNPYNHEAKRLIVVARKA